MSTTLENIIARTRFHLKEPVQRKWSDSVLTTCINIAEKNFVSRDLDLKIIRDATTDSVDGTMEYDLPSNFKSLLGTKNDVIYTDSGGTKHSLVFSYYPDLVGTFGDKMFDTTNGKGTPTYFYLKGNNTIGFVDIPDYTGTNNIILNFYANPTEMTVLADTSDLPDICLEATALKAAKEAIDYINSPSFTVSLGNKSNHLESKYNEEIIKLQGNLGDSRKPLSFTYFGG